MRTSVSALLQHTNFKIERRCAHESSISGQRGPSEQSLPCYYAFVYQLCLPPCLILLLFCSWFSSSSTLVFILAFSSFSNSSSPRPPLPPPLPPPILLYSVPPHSEQINFSLSLSHHAISSMFTSVK